mmetsp:Transcript_17444/g.38466  ORF Transcript_17444/g.38466 Transcript_17444/m.38466 type:complete len:228 (+) Transcript_17444:100-783(+)
MWIFRVLLLSLSCAGHLTGAVQVGRDLAHAKASNATTAAPTTTQNNIVAISEEVTEVITEQVEGISDAINDAIKKIEKETHCECLGWKEAFKKYDANCDLMGPSMCKNFLEKLPNTVNNHTRCLNMYSGAFLEQWCFVSSKCSYGLPNAWSTTPFEGAKYKACPINDGQRRFAMLPFKEIKKLAKQNGIDLQLLVRWSYPSYVWPMFLGSYIGLVDDNWDEDAAYEP